MLPTWESLLTLEVWPGAHPYQSLLALLFLNIVCTVHNYLFTFLSCKLWISWELQNSLIYFISGFFLRPRYIAPIILLWRVKEMKAICILKQQNHGTYLYMETHCSSNSKKRIQNLSKESVWLHPWLLASFQSTFPSSLYLFSVPPTTVEIFQDPSHRTFAQAAPSVWTAHTTFTLQIIAQVLSFGEALVHHPWVKVMSVCICIFRNLFHSLWDLISISII